MDGAGAACPGPLPPGPATGQRRPSPRVSPSGASVRRAPRTCRPRTATAGGGRAGRGPQLGTRPTHIRRGGLAWRSRGRGKPLRAPGSPSGAADVRDGRRGRFPCSRPEGWGSGGVEPAVILAGSLHAVHTWGAPHLAGLCTPQVRVGVGLIHCKGSKSGREPVPKWVFEGGLCLAPGPWSRRGKPGNPEPTEGTKCSDSCQVPGPGSLLLEGFSLLGGFSLLRGFS